MGLARLLAVVEGTEVVAAQGQVVGTADGAAMDSVVRPAATLAAERREAWLKLQGMSWSCRHQQ